MRWHTALTGILAAVVADSTVQRIFGGSTVPDFFKAGERDYVVESMQYTPIPGGEGENYETLRLQFDFWTKTLDDLLSVESALRSLFHQDVQITVGGISMWTHLEDNEEVPGAEQGTNQRSLDFVFRFVRSKYV